MPGEIEINPCHANPGLIDKLWFMPFEYDCSNRTYEIMPDGFFDIVFAISEHRRRIFLAGPYTGKVVVQDLADGLELVAVRFKLGHVPLLVDSTASDLVDEMVQLDRLFGMAAQDVCDLLWQQKTVTGLHNVLDHLLQRHEPRMMPVSKIFHQAAAFIESRGGKVLVQDIADAMGITNRTLERHFMATVGMSPKKFLRIVRFKQAAQQLRLFKSSFMLSDIAVQCGYYDQSHFIKEFKALYGDSPGTYYDRLFAETDLWLQEKDSGLR